MLIVAIVDMFAGLVILAVLRPLVQRKIGRNGFSDNMEDTVLFAAVAAPGVLIMGLMVAMNIELKKLDKSDPEEML